MANSDSPATPIPPVPGPERPGTTFASLVSDLSKLSIGLVFGLYIIGFLIWNAHLGQYGVATTGFLQAEFLSAALVYLLIVFAFALPGAIFLDRFIRPQGKLLGTAPFAMWVFFAVWLTVLSRIQPILFPHYAIGFPLWPFAVMALHLAAALFILKRQPHSRFRPVLCNPDAIMFYLFGYFLVMFLMSRSVDKGFILGTLFLYTTVTSDVVRGQWANMHLPLKVFAMLAVGLLFMQHIQSFGAKQFKQIPQGVGGGRPIRAVLSVSPSHTDLIPLLNLSPWPPISPSKLAVLTSAPKGNPVGNTNLFAPFSSGSANGFFGPIDILLKTDKNLVFIVPPGNQATNVSAQEVRLDFIDVIHFLNEH